ncbi:FabD/lysophospholipase-like protein [Mycena sanguinolenta]|uniref:FabD/lysophospholipase-like protein n=1 Tax=Mycena sanguinolenta TaxID=230812 RepID=A0A8H6XIL9_9AGAR|nr:FabD/lysophospholipase-like protein [Mycena sanguinolenta]
MSQITSMLELSEQLEGTMLSSDHSGPLQLSITGGQGGSGGPGHSDGATGGRGGDGLGPTFNITAQQLYLSTLASVQGSQESKIQAAQIGIKCPLPSTKFQGRKDILDKMHDFFTSGPGTQKVYLLHGLGGAGKTQIALEFIKNSSSCFSDIFFIDMSTIMTIDTGLKNIAIMKGFGDSQQDGLQWLTSKVEEWLVLFDNADDPSINLHDFIPECAHGNIIITSRNPGLSLHAGSHTLVSDMEEADAIALLLRTAEQEATVHNKQIAADIVKALYCLPLAIVQAGAFISNSQSLGNYLDLYTKNQAQLLSEKATQSQDHYQWTVYTTWELSFNQLSPPAAMLLQHCSFLHSNGIAEEIFCYASKYEIISSGPSEEELQQPLEFLSYFSGPAGDWDSLQFMSVTNELRAYSLISFDEGTKCFSVHPLVHIWGQARMSNPDKYRSTMGAILGMAISQRPKWDRILPSLVLRPHLELILQNGVFLPLVFRQGYALVLEEAGKEEQAVRLLETALEECEQILGDDHLDTIGAMGNLGSIYQQLGDYQNARKLEVIVLKKRKQILGDDHPDTVKAMRNLGSTYGKLGEYQNAKSLQVIVLEKYKQILGEDHPGTIWAMGNLGKTYAELGDHQNAKKLEVIVLEKRKRILGEDHPDTIWAMGNLGITYGKLGEYQNAKDLHIIVLEKRKQTLGEDHPDTIWAMGNLGSTYRQMGEYQNAKDLQVIVLEKRKTDSG